MTDVAEVISPSAPTPSLVPTRIVHTRTGPVRHSFAYRSQSWFVDVEELPRLPRMLAPFARFRGDDHFPEPPTPDQSLRQRLDDHLVGAGVTPPAGRVTALLSPRVAGYVFNPLSVFWCHDADERLCLIVAEVHNTYGGRHCYLLTPDRDGRAHTDKRFYVSPFNDVSGRYDLSLPEPGADGRVALSVTLRRDDEQPFVATLRGRTVQASTGAVARAQLRTPLAPLLVAGRIRLQGIRLWLRRLPIHPRPENPRRHSPRTRTDS
ncbi:DUF1365 domain-containing protein [Gordonia sp. ABSL1-1]|uniref:DUF1365 domain-containing protein n=1 Tax=Gordonia sp. ABSL1-1 TaxID=3053923 RepID=UPI002573F6AE|nr:DUF1365 domain-containing protein [Gordonia sp. ABSL1-1]MDL9935410.1 DUF1365 domain-containing protein [Gordonia sp. ABSL1-1]